MLMKKLNALLVGESPDLICVMPSLLFRAGFIVDVITPSMVLKKSKFVSDYIVVTDRQFMPQKAVEKNLDNYDFIVVSDDETLRIVLTSNISMENKLKLLPVKCEENLQHLYSKIDLSKIFSKAHVNTPPFLVASGIDEVINCVKKLGYPVMIKVNAAGGGSGVFECCDVNDIKNIKPEIFYSPLLVQKKIIGTELDLSAFYRDGKLIHFSYSEIKKVIGNKFGPSSLRIYNQLGIVDKQVFSEIENLGKALGANGFVTISCIQSHDDNKRYFIEADMRNNIWAESTRFIGDDPAIKIYDWFTSKKTLQYPQLINKKYPIQKVLSHFLRLTPLEILCNRYSIWKYMPWEDRELLIELLRNKIITNRYKIFFGNARKLYCHPRILIKPIKRFPTTLIRLVLPRRESRLRIRAFFARIYN